MADEAVAEWERTGWRTFHWEPWLAGLAVGARATVLAEAVSWATSLWSALDWDRSPVLPRSGGRTISGSARPAARSLKGRSETPGRRWPGARPGVGRDDHGRSARWRWCRCPVAAPGAWGEELAFLALVAALRSPSRPVPARVLGLWPDAGVHAAVDIDDTVLTARSNGRSPPSMPWSRRAAGDGRAVDGAGPRDQ